MRKIEKDMINAIHNGKSMTKGNTTVTITEQGWTVHLHGNKIAEMEHGKLTVSLAGWGTPTTRSRVSVLLYEFQSSTQVRHISQRKGEQVATYRDGTERIIEDLTEWL